MKMDGFVLPNNQFIFSQILSYCVAITYTVLMKGRQHLDLMGRSAHLFPGTQRVYLEYVQQTFEEICFKVNFDSECLLCFASVWGKGYLKEANQTHQ